MKTPQDLENVGEEGHYCLANDIDMEGAQDFTPIQVFAGLFDGLGYTIRNPVSSDDVCGSLFDQLNVALVKNLEPANATTEHAEIGDLVLLDGPIKESNVIGLIRDRKIVKLRGAYTNDDDEPAVHWMMATSLTVDGQGELKTVVANDPWTGKQVEIDPETRKVVAPENFPLEGFKLDAYRSITLTSGAKTTAAR